MNESFFYSPPRIKREQGFHMLYTTMYFKEDKINQTYPTNKIRDAINYFSGRVEPINFNYIIVDDKIVVPGVIAITVKLPIKIWTQYELKQKKYRECFEFMYL